MRPTFQLAKEVGAGLERSEILFGSLPEQREEDQRHKPNSDLLSSVQNVAKAPTADFHFRAASLAGGEYQCPCGGCAGSEGAAICVFWKEFKSQCPPSLLKTYVLRDWLGAPSP